MAVTLGKKTGGKPPRLVFGIVSYKNGQSNLMIPGTVAQPGDRVDFLEHDNGDLEIFIHPKGLFSIFRGNGKTGTLRSTIPAQLAKFADKTVKDIVAEPRLRSSERRWIVPIKQFEGLTAK